MHAPKKLTSSRGTLQNLNFYIRHKMIKFIYGVVLISYGFFTNSCSLTVLSFGIFIFKASPVVIFSMGINNWELFWCAVSKFLKYFNGENYIFWNVALSYLANWNHFFRTLCFSFFLFCIEKTNFMIFFFLKNVQSC